MVDSFWPQYRSATRRIGHYRPKSNSVRLTPAAFALVALVPRPCVGPRDGGGGIARRAARAAAAADRAVRGGGGGLPARCRRSRRRSRALGLARCQRADRQAERRPRRRCARRCEQQPEVGRLHAALAELLFDRGRHERAASTRPRKAPGRSTRGQLTARWVAAELHRAAGRMRRGRAGLRLVGRRLQRPRAVHGRRAAPASAWPRPSTRAGIGTASSSSCSSTRSTRTPCKPDQQYWPAHLEAALLFLEKYNEADAKAELDAGPGHQPAGGRSCTSRGPGWRCRTSIWPPAKTARRPRPGDQSALLRGPAVPGRLPAGRSAAGGRHPRCWSKPGELNPVDEDTLGRLAAAYGAVDG